jgi:antibiotic biosynthesis monooxygenase (ABM) superfamily enzyme
MDSDAAMKELLDSVLSGDEDRVRELSSGLQHWLQNAGYPPKTIGPWKLGLDWHAALTRCVCDLAGVHVRLMKSQNEDIEQDRSPPSA